MVSSYPNQKIGEKLYFTISETILAYYFIIQDPWLEYVSVAGLEGELSALTQEWKIHCHQAEHVVTTPPRNDPKLSGMAKEIGLCF